ncbi:unnamed protein product [Chironomus riparius]|uniref:Uncharacterized protein n=1 Tax=Chironomus riparius TaxID=315576 RepID=A0A9N9WUL3_9DIPT|nr:unnamed protein product [Chironomus riparius]
MKFEEFCLKLLSFPWLAKLSGWKHHCTEYTQTPFPIITLPGGTFYPTESSATTSPFTFAPTVTPTNPQATTTVNPNTCPPFPTICNPPSGSGGDFGDNSIDPRLVRNKRQTVNGCPCIDIRSALNLLISKGMLGEIPQNKLKNVKSEMSS